MRTPRLIDVPIRRKLMIITMVTTAAALLAAGAAIVGIDYFLFRQSLERDLNVLMQITADNSTAALTFDDPGAAEQTLGALRVKTHVITACIFRSDGSVLAEYVRPGGPRGCPASERGRPMQISAGRVTASREIVLGTRRLGTLALSYDLGELSNRVTLFGATVLAVLIASSLLAFILSSKLRAIIADPVAMLVRATTRVAETNDYSTRAEKRSGDELGLLVDQFNQMLAAIEARDETLTQALADRERALRAEEQARERFRFMAESMPQKIFTANAEGQTIYLNRQWEEFTGMPLDTIKRGWGQIMHPDDLEEADRVWAEALRTGKPFIVENRFRRSDGEYRWHLSRARAMPGPDGKISMWIGSNTDIHEQKEKEAQLQRANDDLQQFAYSASHDLQEPIRNVAVYSEIISQRYRELLDGDGQQYLGFLAEGGKRLVTLINDLLAYTRAGVRDQRPAATQASLALADAISNLAEAIRESGAAVTWDSLPEVCMSEAHLQQIFQNLIGNALKYRADALPRVHISAVQTGGGCQISVQDNGIGIDPQYREKIFGVFKRLHREEKYSGTGIGLAICQRIVSSYGGRIWVESVPGEGATFIFTIPGAPAGLRRAASFESAAG